VYVPDAVMAGEAQASAAQFNPAQLGLLAAPQLQLAAAFWGEKTPLPGRGAGLFMGAPVLAGSALGLGLSRVDDSPAVGVQLHTTLQLAYALRLGRSAAVGVTYAHVWGSSFAGTNTFDLGLSYRLGRYLAVGFAVSDVNQPGPSGPISALQPQVLPRLWAAELAGRPLGTDRLELGIGAAHANDDHWDNIASWARLGAIPVDGIRLYATGEMLPGGIGPSSMFGTVHRFSVGVTLYLDHLATTVGGYAAPAQDDAGAGGALLLQVDGARRRSLGYENVVTRVTLAGIDDDRAFLGVVWRLRALAADPSVMGVLLKVEDLDLGLARIEELRELVAALRARGKRVYAYSTFPSTRVYYLAAACDGIAVHPAGELTLTGMSQTVTFYKTAMDRLGVNVDLVRIAEFKGAMEPFVVTQNTAPVRENKNQLLDDVFGRVVAAIVAGRSTAGRSLDEARVRALIDRGLFTPFEAQLAGLIDAVKDEGDLEDWLRQVMARPSLVLRDPDTSPDHPTAWPARRLAVILVDGNIVDGGSRDLPFDLGSFAGSNNLVAALARSARDPSVRAVVLRVNSPGGSAFASDQIARAVAEVRRAGKPVIVSMGDAAASGGYYISAPADLIYAEPSTISGSIGIFAYKADVQKLMGMVGVDTESYRRGLHSDFYSPYRRWTEEEIQLAGEKIRHFYGLFLNVVAEGRRSRGLTVARVDQIGRGHVWTGAQALGLGLVDRMGGVSAAIDEAARRAGLPLDQNGRPEIVVYPEPSSNLLLKAAGLADEAHADDANKAKALGPALLRAGAGPLVRLLAPLLVSGPTGIQASLPYDIDIR
jgi:protease-4